MDLSEAIRTTGACRSFRPDPVPDEVLARLFEAARYGPQGGNRQPVRYVVVRQPETKRQLRDWYLESWSKVVEGYRDGQGELPPTVAAADDFARHLDEVPVLVVVCAVLEHLLRTDSELDRPSVVGGASIYPSVQNLLLTARSEGIGVTLTTLLCAHEPKVQELLGIPPEVITCATLTLGYPQEPLAKRLTRRPASESVFAERYGEPLFTST
ncbi:MAG: nitroreductase family protein [Acidimicrobiia bacterium]